MKQGTTAARNGGPRANESWERLGNHETSGKLARIVCGAGNYFYPQKDFEEYVATGEGMADGAMTSLKENICQIVLVLDGGYNFLTNKIVMMTFFRVIWNDRIGYINAHGLSVIEPPQKKEPA